MAKKESDVEHKFENKISPLKQELGRNLLPQNVIKVGEQVLHDKNIYILQSVYKQIHAFTKDKLTIESGGMLMGQTIQANGKTNIIVEGFIEGKYSEGTPTTLKFTHKTWEYIHKEAEEHFKDDKLIGWIHTHPNFGIFLSNYDKFIHQNFFNNENQIAYVVDPVQHKEGFFFWINSEIEKCPGFYIYDEIGIEIEPPEDITISVTNEQTKSVASFSNTKSKIIYIVLDILILLSIIDIITLSSQISELHKTINILNEQLLTKNQMIEDNMQALDQNISSVSRDLGKHTIVFLSDSGDIFAKQEYETGDIIVPPTNIPQKNDDEIYTYTFSGWNADLGYVVSDCVYQAVYTRKLREYSIIFEDENGNVISSMVYHFGDEISVPEYYPKEVPNKDKEYKVTWDKEITTVEENKTYRAVLNEIPLDKNENSGDDDIDSEIQKETTEDENSTKNNICE